MYLPNNLFSPLWKPPRSITPSFPQDEKVALLGRCWNTAIKPKKNNVWLSAGSRKCSSTCSRSVFSVDATQASKWSNETGQWRNAQTTALMSPAHKLCCCSEVPFQHVPFFGRWWRRMLRPRGHRGPCGPRLERVTANEWLCHGYLHTAPCGFEKMARKKPLDLLSSDMSSTAAPRQRGRLSWTPSSLLPWLWQSLRHRLPRENTLYICTSGFFLGFGLSTPASPLLPRTKWERMSFSFSAAIRSAITGNMQLTGKAFSQ